MGYEYFKGSKMAKNEHQNENLGYVLGLMGVIAFSLTLPITKFLTPYLSVWDIGFGRSLLAAMGAVADARAGQSPHALQSAKTPCP